MEFAGDITQQDMKELVEDSFSSPIWNAAAQNKCAIEVQVDSNLVPTLLFYAPEDLGIQVVFETVEIFEDDVVTGYEFKPTITTDATTSDDAEEAMYTFKQWSDIAKLALDIYEVEIYPYEYFD